MAKKQKKKSLDKNPLLMQQTTFLQSISENDRDNFFCDAKVEPDRRAEIWMEQADLGSKLVDQYSWATPDARAIRILKAFAPLVEIGCGANAYWCRNLQAAGVDVLGYDIKPKDGGKIDRQKSEEHGFAVKQGGPEVLKKEHLKNRTLFLCYPDEDVMKPTENEEECDSDDQPQSMGLACLEHFEGTHVIHVGELYGDTLSMEQAPWGRSSGPEFQQRLASEYHCLLKAQLTNWLHVRDTISVWKRSKTCSIVFAPDDDDDDDDDDEEEVEYRHIPKDERLVLDCAAPCLAHLLSEQQENANKLEPISPTICAPEGKLIWTDPLSATKSKSKKKRRRTEESESSGPEEGKKEFICPW